VLGDGKPSIEQLGALRFTTRVINEGMRLYPQPPVLIRRALQVRPVCAGPRAAPGVGGRGGRRGRLPVLPRPLACAAASPSFLTPIYPTRLIR
jgi:hypothetical protein